MAGTARAAAHVADAETLLVEHLLPEQIEAVLDLGCGDGQLNALVGQRRPAARCVGLDLSPSMVDAARERFRGSTASSSPYTT